MPASQPIKWKQIDERLWRAQHGKWKFRITGHYTGFWLDAWLSGKPVMPHTNSTLEAAMQTAEGFIKSKDIPFAVPSNSEPVKPQKPSRRPVLLTADQIHAISIALDYTQQKMTGLDNRKRSRLRNLRNRFIRNSIRHKDPTHPTDPYIG
jgi:hypothetical protein